jgi:hypothetical protein
MPLSLKESNQAFEDHQSRKHKLAEKLFIGRKVTIMISAPPCEGSNRGPPDPVAYAVFVLGRCAQIRLCNTLKDVVDVFGYPKDAWPRLWDVP